MKRAFLALLTLVAALLIYVYFFCYHPETLGRIPHGDILKRISQSKNYDVSRKGFVNQKVDIMDRMFEKYSILSSVIRYYFPTTVGWPEDKILEKKEDLSPYISKNNLSLYTWLGHSSILLKLSGKNILIDPVFSAFASPLSFIAKRFQAPVYNLEELPKIDIILISHDHYDHLDYKTVQFFKDKETLFITPLGVDSHLLHWGVTKEKVKTLDWWQKYEVDDLRFICTPSQHMSGREGIEGYKTLWASFVIKSPKLKVYFSGDSGYDTHFKEIGDRFGPFDMAFLENGQYDKRWQAVHLMPYETAFAYKDLKAKRAFPIHWGMFNLSLHHWFSPPLDFYKNCKDCKIDLLPIGKIARLDSIKDDSSIMLNYLKKMRDKNKI